MADRVKPCTNDKVKQQLDDIVQNYDNRFKYQLLDRIRSDCDYYLGNGNRNNKQLWAGNEKDQIEAMKALWNSFPNEEKPEWLTSKQIEDYEKRMQPYSKEKEVKKQQNKRELER